MPLIQKAIDLKIPHNGIDRQIVGLIFLIMNSEPQFISEIQLEVYTVQNIKTKDVHLFEQIGMSNDPQENIMLFKRVNWGKLIARLEVSNYYKEIWHSDERHSILS